MLLRYPRSRSWCCIIAAAAAFFPGCLFAFIPQCDGPRLKPQPVPDLTKPAIFSSVHAAHTRRKRRSNVLGVSVSSALTEEWKSAVLPFASPEIYRCSSPAESLERGDWFKLICGASFEVRTTYTPSRPAIRDCQFFHFFFLLERKCGTWYVTYQRYQVARYHMVILG